MKQPELWGSLAEHMAAGRASLQAQAQKRTHCKRGHALTPDNVIEKKDGSRSCRTCQRARNREVYRRQRDGYKGPMRPTGRMEVYPKEPFLGWLDALDEESMTRLCRGTRTQPRVMYRIRHEQEQVSLGVVDRFVMAVGDPAVLNELYPLCDVCLAGIGEDEDEAKCELAVGEVDGEWRCKEHL